MADARLIVEVYEYRSGDDRMPEFLFIPCRLDDGKRRVRCDKLGALVEDGFDSRSKKRHDPEVQTRFMNSLHKAGFDRIGVEYHPANNDGEAYVSLRNVKLANLADADARMSHDDTIVLYEKYRFTDGNETTVLKDGHRLTLVYTGCETGSSDDDDDDDDFAGFGASKSAPTVEIYLNLTYLEV